MWLRLLSIKLQMISFGAPNELKTSIFSFIRIDICVELGERCKDQKRNARDGYISFRDVSTWYV
jgi:hypothetical protein